MLQALLELGGRHARPEPARQRARDVARLFFVAELFGADVFLLARIRDFAEPRERESEPPFVGCLARTAALFRVRARVRERAHPARERLARPDARATSAASARGTENASKSVAKSDDVKPCATFMNKIATNCSISSGRMICLIFCDSFCAPTPNRRRAWRKPRRAPATNLFRVLPCLESSVNTNFLPVNWRLTAARASTRRSNTVVRPFDSVAAGSSTAGSSSRWSENEPYGRVPSPECSGGFFRPPSFFRGGWCDVVVQCENPSRDPSVLYRGAHGSAGSAAQGEKDADGSRSVALEYRKPDGGRGDCRANRARVRDRSSQTRSPGRPGDAAAGTRVALAPAGRDRMLTGTGCALFDRAFARRIGGGVGDARGRESIALPYLRRSPRFRSFGGR